MADHSTVFYDGGCGLCHRAVRFAIAHDADGSRFRFASLQSEGFRRRVPAAARAGLPDSIVTLTPDGTLLVRSAAVIHVLDRVGGGWKVAGQLLRPRPAEGARRGLRHGGAGAVPALPAARRGVPRDAARIESALRGLTAAQEGFVELLAQWRDI